LASLQTLTFEGSRNFDVEGVVSGTGGITKLGDGALILAGNNTFEGVVVPDAGRHQSAERQYALGSTGPARSRPRHRHFQMQGGITVPENIVMRDVGVGFDMTTMGPIRSIGTSTNVMTGVITIGQVATQHGQFRRSMPEARSG